MKIALIGYGNMGQELDRLINETKKHEIVSVSYNGFNGTLDKKGIAKADVAIDFTSAEIVLENIREVAKHGKPMVIGTTGWYENLPKVKEITNKSKTGLIYGQNFSVGANIFFRIAALSSSMFNKFGGYDVYGFEIHHKGKKDSPSGTAKKLSEVVMQNFPKKQKLQAEKLNRKVEEDELHFASVRGGFNPGLHELIFDSMADEIRLTHAARGRRGFAQGALLAAEFIKNKKGIYSFDELFKN